MKVLTLCIVHKDGKVLLGMKKRGFGTGRWNGFGGKMEEGETIETAARRELGEEAGIHAVEMKELGVLVFEFKDGTNPSEVHIFRVSDFNGEPTETEEMKPQWFETDQIPYGQMWPDDAHWMPLFLNGKNFKGKFLFDRPSDAEYASKILSHELCSL